MIDNISLIAQSAIRIVNKNGTVIYFDPFKLKDDSKDANYIFITHPHFDHFSPDDIEKIKNDYTIIIAPIELKEQIKEMNFHGVIFVEPNQNYIIDDIEFETISAYNINKQFHKKESNWVGYIVKIDDTKIYVAGDTDDTEEARNVNCDVACVPIGGTYTMTYKEAVDLIKAIKPKLAIPTHYKTIVGSVDDAYRFKDLLEEVVDVKILLK